jgi:hypothetical protein
MYSITKDQIIGPNGLVFDAAVTAWLFVAPVIYRVAGDVPEPVANLYAQFVTVDATGRVWFVAWHKGQDVLWTLDTETEN